MDDAAGSVDQEDSVVATHNTKLKRALKDSDVLFGGATVAVQLPGDDATDRPGSSSRSPALMDAGRTA